MPTAARADYISACSPPDSSVRVLPFPDGMPPILFKAFKEHVGDIVAAGERFDATDNIVTGRHRRMIFVWNRGPRFVIATKRGGGMVLCRYWS